MTTAGALVLELAEGLIVKVTPLDVMVTGVVIEEDKVTPTPLSETTV